MTPLSAPRTPTERHRRLAAWVAVVVVALLLVVRSQNQATEISHQATETQNLTQSLQDGLIKTCRDSGNPLRRVVFRLEHAISGQIKADIKQSKSLEASGRYAEFFPNIPPGRLHALLERDRVQKRREIQELGHSLSTVQVHLNCTETYADSSATP